MKKVLIVLGLILIVILLLAQPLPASQVQAQGVYQTPTPRPDGRIMYIVKSGDTCLSIYLLTGVSMDQIRKLNNLDSSCPLLAGVELLLGMAVSVDAKATQGPSPTPTSPLPSPTPFRGTGQVCILLFDDVNGNALREAAEVTLTGGAISLADRTGKVSLTAQTSNAADPICFKDLSEGDYNISVAVPNGYNPTTGMNYSLQLSAGDEAVLDFGAQVSSKAPAASENSTAPASAASAAGEPRSPVLGILGGVLLLGGVGLGIYVLRKRGG